MVNFPHRAEHAIAQLTGALIHEGDVADLRVCNRALAALVIPSPRGASVRSRAYRP